MNSADSICKVRSLAALGLVCAALVLTSGCGGSPPQAEDLGVQFTRSGVVISGSDGYESAEVRVVADGDESTISARRLLDAVVLAMDWRSGVTYRFRLGDRAVDATAPARPSIGLVGTVSLSGATLSIKPGASDRSAGPSAAALSPDGALAAVGRSDGDVSLYSLETGERLTHSAHPGAFIRSLSFVEDTNGTLLLAVGEQSPSGKVTVYEVGTNGGMSRLWSRETAEELGRGAADPSDPYAWVQQPGIYHIIPLPGPDLLVLATHPRQKPGMTPQTMVYRFDCRTGEEAWRWPADGPEDGVGTWCGIDANATRSAVCIYQRGGMGELRVIDLKTGGSIADAVIEPFRPHMSAVVFWRSVAVSADGRTVYAIANDGRGFVWRPDEGELKTVVLGEPLNLGDVPVLVSGAAVEAVAGDGLLLTGVTYLPWELADGQKPPRSHPAANTLFRVTDQGTTEASLGLGHLTQGTALDPSGRWLYIGYASHAVFAPGRGNGLLVIDISGNEPSVAAAFNTAGDVMFGTPVCAAGGRLILLLERKTTDAENDKAIGKDALHLLVW